MTTFLRTTRPLAQKVNGSTTHTACSATPSLVRATACHSTSSHPGRGAVTFSRRNPTTNSQIMFVEKWLAAKGYHNTVTNQMPAWRRKHMSDLTAAFDFSSPNVSIPSHTYPRRCRTRTRMVSGMALLTARPSTPCSGRRSLMATRLKKSR